MIGFGRLSYGQYYDETHRQTADDIKLLRSWNIKTRFSYLEQAGNSVANGVNYYDTGGRVTFIANPLHHEHFLYDDKGRMIYWLDSANDGRRFEKFEYHFGYNDKGAVNAYKTLKTESKFSGTGQAIREDVTRNGTVIERHNYSYNSDGKLTQQVSNEINKDTVGKLLYSHKIFYNKYGDIGSEIIYNSVKDCRGDSTIIINTYDSKGKMIHMQKSYKTMKCGNPASVIERKTISESISYLYDATTGQLTKEAMTSSDPTLNYKKEYVYNESGIIVKELGFDGNGKSTTNILYTYVFYPVRKR